MRKKPEPAVAAGVVQMQVVIAVSSEQQLQ